MELFAAASGDHSRLHTDPAFARRTSYGECIVYGGLETIAMLGVLADETLTRIRSVRSIFPGAVIPGAAYVARAQSRGEDPGEWEVRLTGRGKLLARVTVSTADGAQGIPDRAALLARARGKGADRQPVQVSGIPARGWATAGAYRPGPELQALADRFGAGALDPRLLEGIAWASNVVGASIPGFDGLCASVALAAEGRDQGEAGAQWIRVRDYDERTDRILVEGVLHDGAGGPRCAGVIECFPFAPTPPESAALSADDPPLTAQGGVVVAGASRGAGAALTLALLAGGHEVHAIYSAADAAAAELRRLAGPFADRLTLHRADAANTQAMSELAESIGGPLRGLALCAAPPALPMSLVPESADELAAYVAHSTALIAGPLAAFMALLEGDRPWVLFYSAAQVDAPARDLPQFAAAKAAVEGLARWATTVLPSARVVVARVPRMRTDLANTPSARRTAAAPERVAASILALISDGDPEPGFSILEPAGEELLTG
jgi:NAD(P)-dependent dehydrogenase (short-subunit alcohol dehydrogenase family)